MFDLEKAIEEWLKLFNKHQAFDHGSVREMELHLRDHIDDLIGEGNSEEEAFRIATNEFGEIPKMAKEEFWNQKRKPTVRSVIRLAILKNYYFTTIRNLMKHKNYFFINVAGLAIGIASVLFISLYIINELSYDRFHANYESIYRVSNHAIIRGEPSNEATASAPMSRALLNDYPEVKKATRVLKDGARLIGNGDQKLIEEELLFADAAFFDVFDFELIKGNPKTALEHPRSMILTESAVKKYFGTENPMGRLLTVEEDSIFYTVTGVAKDAPANSHIQFDLLASLSSTPYEETNRWVSWGIHTYVILEESVDIPVLEEKVRDIFYKFMAPEIEYFTGLTAAEWEAAGNRVGFKFIPVKDIHFHTTSKGELEPPGNIVYIYIYALIGAIILAIAIFNFVNLATAHSSSRAKEVGVRKVIGSSKRNLIQQFIFESIILSVIAAFIAVIIVMATQSSFEEVIDKSLAFDLTSNPIAYLAILGLAIVVGILAGSYPSFVLSAFKPVDVLKGTFKSGARAGWLRNLLVTMQFTASIVIIISTLVIYNQIDFMFSKNLGFDKEKVLVVDRPDWLGDDMEVFRNELLTHPNVNVVANAKTLPGKDYAIRSYRRPNDPETFLFLNNQVNYDYLELMGMELIDGRFFSEEYGLDSNAVVINESAAEALGFGDTAVGKNLISAFKKGRMLTIVGVVKDYNFESLHRAITPFSMELDQKAAGYLSVKISNDRNIRETVQFIEEKWNGHTGSKPFQSYFFDQEYENLYTSETNTGRLLMIFASLSVLIACLGLIGLITYTAAVRRKEIGIRKVLGASTTTLVRLMSSKVAQLILIATVISWPLAYLATDYWLRNFSDRVPNGLWIYLVATVAMVLVVGFAISFQTIRAATSNPVDSLRNE